MNQKTFNKLSWGLLSITLGLAIISWGIPINWKIFSITGYAWFPLLGLIAWITMWNHYVIGAVRIFQGKLDKPKYYSSTTETLVLISLILHPGILAVKLQQAGLGFPPDSYYKYVGPTLKITIASAIIALLIFLSFEIFNRLKNNKKIKKYWLLISLSQSLAIVLIFVHALRLGTHLGPGWFLNIWLIMGVSLLPCFYIIHKHELINQTT